MLPQVLLVTGVLVITVSAFFTSTFVSFLRRNHESWHCDGRNRCCCQRDTRRS